MKKPKAKKPPTHAEIVRNLNQTNKVLGDMKWIWREPKPGLPTVGWRELYGGTSIRKDYDVLVAYAKVKLQQKDWHGLSDAANDIRVLVATHPELETDDGTPA